MIVDFLPARQVANAVVRPISEPTVVAMYLNNRAAEVLGEVIAARAWDRPEFKRKAKVV